MADTTNKVIVHRNISPAERERRRRQAVLNFSLHPSKTTQKHLARGMISTDSPPAKTRRVKPRVTGSQSAVSSVTGDSLFVDRELSTYVDLFGIPVVKGGSSIRVREVTREQR